VPGVLDESGVGLVELLTEMEAPCGKIDD